MSEVILSCSQFTCIRAERVLFKPIELVVAAGECHKLAGANGSGKSTCLLAFSGLRQYEGKFKSAPSSFLGHFNGLQQSLTVAETILAWQQLNSNNIMPSFISFLPKESLVANLSSGQKRILAWARLVIEQNSLWLLDEPLINIDKAMREQLIVIAQNHLASNGAIVLATHMHDFWQLLITNSHKIEV